MKIIKDLDGDRFAEVFIDFPYNLLNSQMSPHRNQSFLLGERLSLTVQVYF
jgi:hypothetical protein